MSRIGREQILTMLPHAGAMCLLDDVLDWDAQSLHCRSRRYRAADNPLRRVDGVLGAASGVEIAAQAMAVHGHLTASDREPPSAGYLVSLRDVRLRARHLDAIDGDLLIEVKRLLGDAKGASYSFMLTVKETEMLSGRAMVLLRSPG